MSAEQPKQGAPSPGRIMEFATGYWGSMVLLTLNELRICDLLATGPKDLEALAAEAGLEPRALGYLLDASVGLGFLDRDAAGLYSNGPEAAAFLVEGRPGYMGGGLRYALDSYPVWGSLPAAVRTGEPQVAAEEYLGRDKERTRRFVYGMHHRGKAMARGIAQAIELPGRRSLLDLGGGSGVYSILLCQKHPELRTTLFDLPGVLEVASEIVADEGVAERVTTRPGDYHEDDLGQGYDAALLNGMIHRETPEFAQELFRRVFAALDPGGVIVVGDVMLDETGHGPLFPTLFALNMLLTAPGGGAHSVSAQVEWLQDAGFVEPRIVRLPPPALHTLIFASRP